MLPELSTRLIEIVEKKRLKLKLEQDLRSVEKELIEKTSRLEQLRLKLEKEKVDVEKLERTSLSAMFYSVLGSREQQLEKERQEMLSAQLLYRQTKHQVDYLKQEQNNLSQQLGKLTNIESEHLSVLAEKERLLRQSSQSIANELSEIEERVASHKSELKEIGEAIKAGKEVASGLGHVIESLENAEGWGTWDLLGGGVISTAIKHSKIDEARDSIQYVQTKMSQFKRELADVEKFIELKIDIIGFETFADYFFDGLIFDWIVQSKIVDSLERSIQAQELIVHTIEKLENLYRASHSKLKDLQNYRVQLIERP